jgi:nitrate/nitrite transport system ATP-binding protein
MIPALEISKLAKSYDGSQGPAVIVKDFSLKVADGEFVCIIGHSGCGKSTVLSIAMGLNEATEGGIIIAGREVDGPGLDRGVVFQSSALLPWLTARQNVLLAVDQVNQNLSARVRHGLAEKFLNAVGLNGVAESFPDELSAGMRQRVGIARAFALEPRVLLLDEPFSLLDVVTRMELQDQLIRLCAQENKTVLMVTHDVDEALLLADRIVMMTNGPAATVGEIIGVPFARPRDRLSINEDPLYHRIRSQLLNFLEKRAQGTVTGMLSLDRQTVKTENAKVTAEELFVIEKYTGFNRFRGKFRKQQQPIAAITTLTRARAKALS